MVKSVFSPPPTRNIDSTAAPTFNPETFQPLDDLVLIRRDEREAVINGIEIPDMHRRKQLWGTVIKTGPGHRISKRRDGAETSVLLPMTVRAGDHVAYVDVGHEVKFTGDNGAEYVVMGECQLLGYEREGDAMAAYDRRNK